jgi:hypothetical protein
MSPPESDSTDELAACTGLADPRWRAVELLADAWGPALDRSYRLGYGNGFDAGRWDAEHKMAESWHRVWLRVKATLDQPTRDELARLRGESA